MRRFAKLILVVGVLAGAAACDEPPAGGEEQLPVSLPASPDPVAVETDEPEAAVDVPGASQMSTVLASHEFTNPKGQRGRVEITRLQRQGKSVLLVFTFTNLSDESWYTGDMMGAARNDWTVAGVTLVDPVNGKRYLVARSGSRDGPCVCSKRANVHVAPEATVEFNATFAAPPPDVTQINVDIPNVGVLLDVPIS